MDGQLKLLQELKVEYLRLVSLDPSWKNRINEKEAEIDEQIDIYRNNPTLFKTIEINIRSTIQSRINVNKRKGLV